MFKKFIVATILACSLSALAAERITVLLSFSAASGLANSLRSLCQEMNRAQTKYEFVFEAKPGAGGAIAANYVLQNPKNTIISGTSTFFLRSNFDRTTGYDINSFQGVLVRVVGSPVVLYSSKYASLKELKQADSVTTAISGYGSHSNLMASILNEAGAKVIIVNYPSLIDATKDVLGKHVDTAWQWLYDIQPLVDSNKVAILAITGTRSISGHLPFASQGLKGFENASTSTAVYASTEMPAEKVREIHELLKVANRHPDIQAGYAREHGTTPDLSFAETQAWFNQQARFWADQSSKVKPLK
jgi:tripartite-type tricarboxylate transporter receptor subunit TctC